MLGREREKQRGVALQGAGRGGSRTNPAQEPQEHLLVTCMGRHRTAKLAGSSETPSHSPSPIPLSRSKCEAKMGKMTCLRHQVAHVPLLQPFCVISGGCELFVPTPGLVPF